MHAVCFVLPRHPLSPPPPALPTADLVDFVQRRRRALSIPNRLSRRAKVASVPAELAVPVSAAAGEGAGARGEQRQSSPD